LFFFSSRRRHTSSDRDWSSDVCSSDLVRHRQGIRGPVGLLLEQMVNALALRKCRRGVVPFDEALMTLRFGQQRELPQPPRRVLRSEERRVGKEGGGRWCRRGD